MPLLLTDVVMPGLSGPALAEQITALRPGTKVLYTSGYNDGSTFKSNISGQDCVTSDRHYGFLEKPFTREDLLRKVRELLDSDI
jgi:DNA-binding NtrC family response regulator